MVSQKPRRHEEGFTLIEIVMVILLIAILAAVTIPQFMDFRKEAKDAAIQGALGALRGSVALAVSAIALKEDPATNPPAYPTLAELQGNAFLAAAPNLHPVMAGKAMVDASQGLPENPWTKTTTVQDCTGQAKAALLAAPNNNNGWCYNPTTGMIWPNSNLNGGPTTENNF